MREFDNQEKQETPTQRVAKNIEMMKICFDQPDIVKEMQEDSEAVLDILERLLNGESYESIFGEELNTTRKG